ncbi:arsenate reductase ArsC [Flavisphingomonas formosensis]|uniref:arsenate reductase ArsC n=1 Tax=Flavisphingomonas formosensis TaxID=861534 RepID=UPI0012F8BFF9|nr:arsenate reductase ArsC [Sphingomonas formosensis]
MSRKILFLCTGNSARSVLAEALAGRLGAGRLQAYSAGSQPKGVVNPGAVRWLEANGFDPTSFRSKSWDEFAGPDAVAFDFIITVCDNAAGEVCPIWPGKPSTAHWGMPDPADAGSSEAENDAAFAETARVLTARLEQLLSLPLDELSGPALKERLAAIGAAQPETIA